MKTRGMGRVYRPKYRDKKTGETKEIPTWWVQYCQRGKVYRESSHSANRIDAVRLLRKRHGEMGKGGLVGPDVEKTTFEDMAAMVMADYKANGRSSIDRVEDAIDHLRGFFGGTSRAVDITSDVATAYVTARQDEKAANSTINNELSALKRMFRLAERAAKVAQCPYVAKLQLNNVRKGFFESEQFDSVLSRLPGDLKPMAVCAYVTGWRVHDEILTRQRHHVDLRAGWLRLEPGETKNRKGRMFPLTPRLREVLEKQITRTEALQRAMGQIIPWLFHREGKPIKSFRRSWITACRLAGVPGRIPHDFRRSAVRNLERAGVPRSAAMEMVGHKTEAIYRRYAIADEGMLREAGEKLSALHQADEQRKSFGKVLAK